MKEGHRILAIDLGEKRTGFALSIPSVNIAQPLKTIDTKEIWKELGKIFNQYNVKTVVIGLPLHINGRPAKSVVVVKEVAEKIRAEFKVPVKLWDERLTSKDAERILQSMGKRPNKNKGLVDKLAATLILEEYLSRYKESVRDVHK
jgi:putative Holliday junction resolvase